MSNPQSINRQIDYYTLGEQLRLEVDSLCSSLVIRLPLERPPAKPIAWQQTMYADLVNAFKNAANNYVSLAKGIIPSAEAEQVKRDGYFPAEYYYEEVLRKITEQVRLLAQLYFSLDHTLSSSGHISTFGAMQAIISDVSRLILEPEPPVLILIESTQFEYVHLNYVSGVGIIGVPPYALVRPYPDLPILWHEVAGYAVARQRASGALENHAKTLQHSLKAVKRDSGSLFDFYRDQYERSLSQDVRVKLTVTDKSVGVVGREEVRRYFARDSRDPEERNVDTDYDWQMHWLGQILEDLFGLQLLGKTMRDSLDFALKRAYETSPDIGDHTHPSPALRLKIADEYLAYDPASISAAIEQETDETSRVAKIIVKHLFDEDLIKPEESGSSNEIVKLVKEITRQGIHPPTETQLKRAATAELTNNLAILDEFRNFRNRLQTSVRPPIQISAEPRGVQTPLESLRSFVFTETDERGPGGQVRKAP